MTKEPMPKLPLDCIREEIQGILFRHAASLCELLRLNHTVEANEQRVLGAFRLSGYNCILSIALNPSDLQLSKRQREIALLVKKGLPNKAIAVELGISEATVAVHLQRIFRKFHVDSRISLASRYIPEEENTLASLSTSGEARPGRTQNDSDHSTLTPLSC
jgi:DNA-binding NarL/FixJ family response regulator